MRFAYIYIQRNAVSPTLAAEVQIAFGSVYLRLLSILVLDLQRQGPTLIPDLVQEINDYFILHDSHTVEVSSNSICKLLFALPSLFLSSGHSG